MRHICYVTGTRADFGLMNSTLKQINNEQGLRLSVAITGMHLQASFGDTKEEIIDEGFEYYIVPSGQEDGSREAMSIAVGEQVKKLTQLFSNIKPQAVLLLGDRGEMLAAAISSLYLNIPVIHIHGGELSGTVDESIRHAISKLSHYHFTSTYQAKERLIKMGEKPESVFVTGAPGLDDIVNTLIPKEQDLFDYIGFDASKTLILLAFHPVVQDAESAGEQMKVLLSALDLDIQTVILRPNADAGSQYIREAIDDFESKSKNVNVFTHLPRNMYLALLAYASVLVGNSSSGIIEAATYELPVVNIGERQANRERNTNVIDTILDASKIKSALDKALSGFAFVKGNIYGNGDAGVKISKLLSKIELGGDITRKRNVY